VKNRSPASRSRLTENTVVTPAPRWKPFRFQNLERFSRRQVQLLRNLEWLLPNVHSTGEVGSSVRRRLHEILEENVSLQAEYVHLVPMSALRRYVGEPTCLAVLAPLPNKTRGLMELELSLAHLAIDLMLGGAGEAVGLRPLTDLEEGMMTYLLIETLKALSPSLDPALPRLRLESVARSFDEVGSLIGEDESVAVVQFKVIFGTQPGTLRLFLPEAVLATAHPPADAAVRRARRATDARTHGARLRNLPATFRVEVGLVEIGGGELAQLREGDVVLVDALSCRPDQAQHGTARLKLGLGQAGHVEVSVAVSAGVFRVTVLGFVLGAPPLPGEQPAAGPQPLGGQQPDESTSPGVKARSSVEGNADGSDLMNDIPLQISVELARLTITAEEVVAMKVGQVFDLSRTAGDPLELSVNGRVVARGELVEIDGNLGVRIVTLAG
jgi:flagellar motor switch protein FliM